MTHQDKDTDWSQSIKGNWWRRLNDTVLTVGEHRHGDGYWVCINGNALSGRSYCSLTLAQMVAESYAKPFTHNELVKQLD